MSKEPKKQKVCSFLDLIFGKAVVALSRMDTGSITNIFKIEDNCVWFDISGKLKLYGLKIEGDDNTVKRFSNTIDGIIPQIRFAEHPEMGIFFIKKENRQAVYVYSFDGRVIKKLSKDHRIPNLNGEELVASLLDCVLNQQHIIKDSKLVPSGVATSPFIPYGLEMASGKFKARAELAQDNILREYTIYQGEEYESLGDFNPINLFRANWEGALWIWVNFSANAIEGRIKTYESTAKFADKTFAGECSAIVKREDEEVTKLIREGSAIINSILILKDEQTVDNVQSAVSIVFSKNYLTGPKIVGKNIMLTRDSAFDAIVPKETALKFLASPHKIQTDKSMTSDFHGKDISGNFIEYSFANNDNPHSALFGKTGSGKSVQAILILEKILGFSHSTKTAARFFNQKIRYTDVGFTSGNIVETLKSIHPDEVEIFGSDVSSLRFGLLDYELSEKTQKLVDEDMDFLSNFVSFALEIEKEAPLGGAERTKFADSVHLLLQESQENEMYIRDLASLGGYDKIVEELDGLGYGLDVKLRSLPEEYRFLKRRTLQELVKFVGTIKSAQKYTDQDRLVFDSLEAKLKSIAGNRMINSVANMRIGTSKQFFHIDFNSIKQDPRAFNISYWMIMKTWLKDMEKVAIPLLNKGQKPETVYFFIDEAHNFFVYKTFEQMLNVAAREIRKFGGRLFFITQKVTDIPQGILEQLSTKMVISSASEKEQYKEVVRKIYPQSNMEEIDEIITNLEDRMLFIMSDKGVIGCQMEKAGPDEFYKPKKLI